MDFAHQAKLMLPHYLAKVESTCVFSVVQVVPSARLEVRALDDVGERKDDVATELGVDIFR